LILRKMLPPDLIFLGYKTPNSISAGALPQTPLEELTALLRPPSWILGGLIFMSSPGPQKS